ncbi:MAG: macro domain-containing protein [Eubacterium sp.]|nr:macro domain-containing protein [Eubacterium sp.]
MPFKIVRNDITRMKTEAIVNTANEAVAVGTGCDYAVYQAAGYDQLLQYRKEHIGAVEEGEVFLTPAFDLPAKYIIHAVSPVYTDGKQGEEEKLRSCYRKSLELARERGVRSIAFPLISTGGFGYPKEEGMRIAVDEIHSFLLANEMMIYLVVFDGKATHLGERLYPDLEAYIDRHYVEEKNREEYAPYLMTMEGTRIEGRDGKAEAPGTVESSGKESARRRRPFLNWSERRRKARKTEREESWNEAPETPHLSDMSFGSAAPTQMTPSIAYEELLTDLEEKLEERLAHKEDTFSQYLLYLIESKGLTNADVWKNAIVDKKVFSKIKNNVDYHPNKRTALCLCVGARLNMDETRDLLARAGYALSPCDKTDIIFSYFIERELFDMIELDIQLEEHGLPCIIS